MVFFFTPRGCEPRVAGEPANEDYMIYMGLDKHENEVGAPPQLSCDDFSHAGLCDACSMTVWL